MNLDITELETSPVEGVMSMCRVTDSVGMDKVIRISRQTLDEKFEVELNETPAVTSEVEGDRP